MHQEKKLVKIAERNFLKKDQSWKAMVNKTLEMSPENWKLFLRMIPDGGMVQMIGLSVTVEDIVTGLKKLYPNKTITTETHYLNGQPSGNVIFRIK